jgi:hypothetical protein
MAKATSKRAATPKKASTKKSVPLHERRALRAARARRVLKRLAKQPAALPPPAETNITVAQSALQAVHPTQGRYRPRDVEISPSPGASAWEAIAAFTTDIQRRLAAGELNGRFEAYVGDANGDTLVYSTRERK